MIVFNDLRDAGEICRLAPTTFHPGVDQCVSRRDRWGAFIGGAILTDYTGAGGSVCMHAASVTPRWLCRDLLWVVFDYAFTQLGVARVFVQVSSKNQRSLTFTSKLGFKHATVIPGVFLDADLHVKCLEAAECRWTRLAPRSFVSGGIRANG
jgi:RimJ/RimL family protein N-acetyltransferase